MAPRRGGGSGYSYGSDYGSDSPWLEKTHLPGSGWHDRILITYVVFAGILMAGLWAIAIWNFTIRKRALGNRLINAWYSFKLALLVAIIVSTFKFIHCVLLESQALVLYCYYIIQGIIYNFEPLSQIALLTTIYTIFVYFTRSYDLASSAPGGSWKAIHILHFCFCGVLGAIWLALLGYKIALIVIGGPTRYSFNYSDHLFRPYHQLTGAYYILYMLASIEVLALSAYFFTKKTTLLVPRLILILLPAVVTFPLMVRSIWGAAVVIRTNLQERSSTVGTYVARTVFYIICSLLIYGGIVLIGRLIEKDQAASGQGILDQYSNGPTLSVWPNKEGMGSNNATHPPPLQYPRYVQPGTQQYPQQNGNSYPQAMSPGQMYHSNQTSPVNGSGYPAPVGQVSPYGQQSSSPAGFGQANGYPGMQQYGQQYGQQPQPQQLASEPVRQRTGELPVGQPVQRPEELSSGQGVNRA